MTIGDTAMTEIAVRAEAGQLARFTPPTPDQIVELLQRCAAYDKRTFGLSEKAAWASASVIGRWTYDEAAAAIDHHKATRTEYLEPSHITRWIDISRRKNRLRGTAAADGSRIPSHAEAMTMWATRMRQAGANPTAEQTAHAEEVLAELLDGVPNALMIVQAITVAARRLTSRIEWVLEKLGRDSDKAERRLMPDVPLEYIPDRLLNVRFATAHADYPREWVRYDPFGDEAERYRDLAKGQSGVVLNDPTPREMPDWVVESLKSPPRNGTPERGKLQSWIDADLRLWEAERIKVVRRWYAEHPDQRPTRTSDGPTFEGY